MSKGFTLFEFIIVLALILCIVYLSASIISFSTQTAIRLEVDRLYAALQYMQRKAVLERTSQTLIFNTARNSYVVDHEHVLQGGSTFGVKKGVCGPPSCPSKPLKKQITWPLDTITFFQDGTIAAGAVYLTDQHGSCLYALTCDASCMTHIRRYCFDGGWRAIN